MSRTSYLRIFSLFFITWFVFALTYSQIIPYMTYLNMDESTRSWVFTSSAILGMAVQFLVGYWSDKYQRMKIFFMSSIIFLLIFSALAFSTLNTTVSFYFVCISIFIALFRVASNLAETWTYQINDEVMKRFGLIRTFGSIGWAIGSIVVAAIIDKYTYHSLPIWIIVLSLVVLLLSLGLDDSQKVSNPSTLKMRDINELFRNPQFTISVAIFFILFLVYTMEGLTVIDKMLEIGSSNQQVGYLWSFQALVELPLMIFGIKFIEKFGVKKILVVTSIAFFLRYFLYGLATSGNQMILISGLQLITYPFMLLSQKVLINYSTPMHLRASGHMVMTGITSNIPIIIVPLISSFLHRFISYSMILMLAGILCLVCVGLSLKLSSHDNQ